jgi:hypothetical protein
MNIGIFTSCPNKNSLALSFQVDSAGPFLAKSFKVHSFFSQFQLFIDRSILLPVLRSKSFGSDSIGAENSKLTQSSTDGAHTHLNVEPTQMAAENEEIS